MVQEWWKAKGEGSNSSGDTLPHIFNMELKAIMLCKISQKESYIMISLVCET